MCKAKKIKPNPSFYQEPSPKMPTPRPWTGAVVMHSGLISALPLKVLPVNSAAAVVNFNMCSEGTFKTQQYSQAKTKICQGQAASKKEFNSLLARWTCDGFH
jgi:hypothetical protein